MKVPPDHAAVLRAENLLSAAGITVAKWARTISSCSRSPESMSRKITPCLVSSSFTEWYTTSDSYWAVTPARNLRSASGMPSLSNVRLTFSGTSSQLFSARSVERR